VHSQLCFAPEVLHVLPWPDDVIDNLGHDPRSTYVEEYWLGSWARRRSGSCAASPPASSTARRLDLDLAETARSLGLGDRSGRHSPFVRSINRTIQFGLAQLVGEDALSVRRRVPPLNRARVCRLSPALQARTRPGRATAADPADEHQLRERAS